ncbi:MAG: PIN domain-containing protein [Cyanobacteria bacterium P01_G01_bin.49]
MKPTLVDTDILLLFFRKHPLVVDRINDYLQIYTYLNISVITFYEIYHQLNNRRLALFEEFISYNKIIPITQDSLKISANIYKNLFNSKQQVSDLNLLVAGMAIAHNLSLATTQIKTYQPITELVIKNWSIEDNEN